MIGQARQGCDSSSEADIRIEAPFLQLVLTRLWHEERAQESQALRQETLHALGGAGRIIRTHMDSAMNALSPEEQETAAGIFRYMVTPSGTKLHTVADLEYYAKSARPWAMLKKLAQEMCASYALSHPQASRESFVIRSITMCWLRQSRLACTVRK
jgi:hypothetical protein